MGRIEYKWDLLASVRFCKRWMGGLFLVRYAQCYRLRKSVLCIRSRYPEAFLATLSPGLLHGLSQSPQLTLVNLLPAPQTRRMQPHPLATPNDLKYPLRI